MSRYAYYRKPEAPLCEICKEPSDELAVCYDFQCGRMVCPDCSVGSAAREQSYYRKTLCKECEKRRAKEEEELKRLQAVAEALEDRRKVFRETMVKIEISRLCRNSMPCCHGVTAYDAEGQSCDMGVMNAHAIHALMVKLNQPLNSHIENVLRIHERYKLKRDAELKEADADLKERCKEWGFVDM